MTGTFIVDAAGMLAFALIPEIVPVARSSIAIPTRAGSRWAAERSRVCKSERGFDIAAHGALQNSDVTIRVRTKNVRTFRALYPQAPKEQLFVRLLALSSIWDAVSGRRTCAAREAGECDQSGDIRQRLHELAGNAGALQRELQRFERTEEQCGCGRAQRVPASEDHGGERNEAASRTHSVGIEIQLGH